MQIVINIDDKMLETLKRFGPNAINTIDLCAAVVGGTPLPEHHGRLIDAYDACGNDYHIECVCCPIAEDCEICAAPTIIPATKEKNSEKVIGTDVCSFTDKVCIGKDCRVCDINKTDHNERR